MNYFLLQRNQAARSVLTTKLTRCRKRQSEARHERNGGAVGSRVQRLVGQHYAKPREPRPKRRAQSDQMMFATKPKRCAKTSQSCGLKRIAGSNIIENSTKYYRQKPKSHAEETTSTLRPNDQAHPPPEAE